MSYAERRLEMTFVGEKHVYYPGKVSPRLARECRRLFGIGPAELWPGWFRRPIVEVDQVAEMLWLAKRQMAEIDGTPETAMTLEQLDDLITADLAQDSFTVEFKDFGTKSDDDPTPEVDRVTEMELKEIDTEDGPEEVAVRVVEPDPED